MNYIIFDLECTCWKERPSGMEMETIEIGAVKLDDFGEWIESFGVFIRPTISIVSISMPAGRSFQQVHSRSKMM